MSKKKFRFLIGLMLFSLCVLITFVSIEVISYLNKTKVPIELEELEDIVDSNTNDDTQDQNIEDSINVTDSGNEITPTKQSGSLEESEEVTSIDTQTTILFGGDVLFTNDHLHLYDKKDNTIDGFLSDDLAKELKASDITMINQEFPFSNRGIKMEDKQYTFRADPQYVKILKEIGVDIVTLANNHSLDYGIDALLDTLTTLDSANIKRVGAGINIEDAKKAEYTKINDKKIAFLGASRVIPVYEWNATNTRAGLFTTYDPTLLLSEIEAAKKENDLVIVYVHWGIEREKYPEEYQRDLGKKYIDAGADIVVGSHPHVLQGIEYYKGKPIIYSLGNFIFGRSTYSTMLLKANIDSNNVISLSLIPCISENSFTKLLSDNQQKADFYQYMEQLSFNIIINSDGTVREKE